MLSNHVYNLLEQLTTESKSVMRIKKHYLDDGADCSGCKTLWKKVIDEKEATIKELEQMVKKCWR